jgi:Methyltransferase domain
MNHGVRFSQDFKVLWQEGMKNWEGHLPQRMTDDSLEEKFWNQFLQKKSVQDEPDSYVSDICEELLALIHPEDEVLEIGPGWGNYTFAAAKKARALTCVDSSSSVLEYLALGAKDKDLSNMKYMHAKWEEYQSEMTYDVVFGVNCYYRMQEIDQALIHMNNAARRLAIIGMTSGPEKPHYWEIYETLGYRVRFSRRDYIYLTNLLYELGIDVNCKILDLQKTYLYDTEEQFFEHNLSAILDPEYDREKAAEILRKYLVWVDGKPAYVHHFKAALLFWKPEKKIGLPARKATLSV